MTTEDEKQSSEEEKNFQESKKTREDVVNRIMTILNQASDNGEFSVTIYNRLNTIKTGDIFKDLRVVFETSEQKQTMPIAIHVVSTLDELMEFLNQYCLVNKARLETIKNLYAETTVRHVMRLLKEQRLMVINASAPPGRITERFRKLLAFYNQKGNQQFDDLLVERAIEKWLGQQKIPPF